MPINSVDIIMQIFQYENFNFKREYSKSKFFIPQFRKKYLSILFLLIFIEAKIQFAAPKLFNFFSQFL